VERKRGGGGINALKGAPVGFVNAEPYANRTALTIPRRACENGPSPKCRAFNAPLCLISAFQGPRDNLAGLSLDFT
jgi:hypothetical protein